MEEGGTEDAGTYAKVESGNCSNVGLGPTAGLTPCISLGSILSVVADNSMGSEFLLVEEEGGFRFSI